jgi:predicted PurR-regulated permease PerM
MAAPDPTPTPNLEFKALLALVAIATVLFALIIWPFFGALCWAVFIAIVFWPLHQRFLHGSRGRHNTAALASLLVVVVIVILPMSLLAATIVEEASMLVQKLRSGEISVAIYFQRALEVLPDWLRGMLERFGIGELGAIQQKLLDSAGQSGQAITSRVFSIGQDTLDIAVSFFVMLYVLFFLFRDGGSLTRAIARTIPLRQEHTQRVLHQFATVVRATVKGNIVVALIQGTLGGMAFAVLGVSGAVLWGAVMALLSLLPAVGAVLVWGPVALYFFFTGELVRGIGLTIWGALVIGLVDNILRPILVGKETRMPDYLILVATLGGLVVFGLNGFVIGPVIAAMFLVSWDMLALARQHTVPADASAAPPTPDDA